MDGELYAHPSDAHHNYSCSFSYYIGYFALRNLQS